jgi:hypothetical protein
MNQLDVVLLPPRRGLNQDKILCLIVHETTLELDVRLNFKPLGIDKYDGSTNPTEWLEVYQLAIKAVVGDLYVMANYLPIFLSSSTRT